MRCRSRYQRESADTGSVVLAQVVALGGLLVFVVLCAQMLLWSYGRGAVRAAAQEAVQIGSRPDRTIHDCEARFAEVVGGLLGGSLGDGVKPPICRLGVDRVELEVEVHFGGWLPGVPDWTQHIVATAPRDPMAELDAE